MNTIKTYSDISSVLSAGKSLSDMEITNNRGRVVSPRKYHMSNHQRINLRTSWESDLSLLVSSNDITQETLDSLLALSGKTFFNGYRFGGAYYGAIQSLFLLGSNLWHPYKEVRDMMEYYMDKRIVGKSGKSSWSKFAYKSARLGAFNTKDLLGRIIDNFKILQRLGGLHPYGLKLKEVCSCIDIKRGSDGIWWFKLNTSFSDIIEVKPSYDVSAYKQHNKLERQ